MSLYHTTLTYPKQNKFSKTTCEFYEKIFKKNFYYKYCNNKRYKEA